MTQLTMRAERRRYRSTCTYVVDVFADDGVTVLARYRHRRPGCKSFRAWIRAEYGALPLPNVSPKLQRILANA